MLIILLQVGSVSAIPHEEWNRTFRDFVANSAQQTLDGGYILAGDETILKTNANGDEEWSKTFKGENPCEFYSVQQTSDGGYILAGNKNRNSDGKGYYDPWLLKTDANGSLQWSKTLIFSGIIISSDQQTSDHENSVRDYPFERVEPESPSVSIHVNFVQQTLDGGYILAGNIREVGEMKNAWLAKTDADGYVIWDKTFGEITGGAYSVRQTLDGGYIFIGLTYLKYYPYGTCGWLVKIDRNGTEMWNQVFEGGIANSVKQTLDGGYILAGFNWESYEKNKWDAWLVKTDENGNEIWNKTFGGTLEENAYSVQQTSDGGYILAGYTQTSDTILMYSKHSKTTWFQNMKDAWLVKTDANGNEVWNMTLNVTIFDVAKYVQQTSDGGYIIYIIAGNTKSFDSDQYSGWLIKISSDISSTQIPSPTASNSQLEQEFTESREWLNVTEEKQSQQDNTTTSWLESKINSLLDWIKSFT